MEEKEIWKDIVGYEGLYQISNLGNVKSLRRYIQRRDGVLAYLREKIIRPSKDKNGYYFYVKLSNNGRKVKFYIHRLVATAFLEKPKGKNYIDHIDGNKLNNTIFVNKDGSIDSSKTNIRWCTPSENNNNKITYIRHKASMNNPIVKEKIFNSLAKTKCERSPKKVYVYDMSNNYVGSWDSISKASKSFSIDSGTISYAMRSRSHYAKGYKWYDKMIEPTQ